jgi:hypothetical protein
METVMHHEIFFPFRNKVPPRPPGQRSEPENNAVSMLMYYATFEVLTIVSGKMTVF